MIEVFRSDLPLTAVAWVLNSIGVSASQISFIENRCDFKHKNYTIEIVRKQTLFDLKITDDNAISNAVQNLLKKLN